MKVLLTSDIPKIGVKNIEAEGIEVVLLKNKKNLIKELKKNEYDGLITLLTDDISDEVINSFGDKMKIIANYAVGFNNIAIDTAKEKGIAVTNTPGVLTDTVAEHTVALIIASATRLVEADKYLRKGLFKGWSPDLFLGHDLRGKTLAVFGGGRIGGRVAEIMKAFQMEIAYYDMVRNKELEEKVNAKHYKDKDELIRIADVITLHLPLNQSTKHFIDKKTIDNMKPTAILVNTSRGPIIDEKELANALLKKKIFSAGLDVFEDEPKINKILKKCNNAILLPHIASASITTRNKMSTLVADNIISVLKGNPPKNPVF